MRVLWEPVRKSTEVFWDNCEPWRIWEGETRKKGNSVRNNNPEQRKEDLQHTQGKAKAIHCLKYQVNIGIEWKIHLQI